MNVKRTIPLFLCTLMFFSSYAKDNNTIPDTEFAEIAGPQVDQSIMRIPSGQEFSITLYENGSTGYLWYLLVNQAPNENPITFIRKEQITKNNLNRPQLTGEGMKVRWFFKVNKPGTHHLSFAYERLWELGKNPAAKAINITIEATE